MSILLQACDISAQVQLKNNQTLTTVNQFSFCFNEGSSYSIVGKSGSGKTSILSILGLLNRQYTGELLWNKIDTATLTDRELSHIRAREIGFVFQNYSLIPHLKIWENLELVLRYAKDNRSRNEQYKHMVHTLDLVELHGKEELYPTNLSGGELQRVALARALVCNPKILMCDEPTGALDFQTGTKLMNYLLQETKGKGLSLILVTHDRDLANLCDTQLEIHEGSLVRVTRHS